MSLLSQAAPYDTTENSGGTEAYLPQQRRTAKCGGKTIKKRPQPGQPVERKRCVEALMMMTGGDSDDDDESGLADFQPPAKPELTRVPDAVGQQTPSSQTQTSTQAGLGQQQAAYGSQPSSYSVAHSPPPNLRADVGGALAAIQQANGGSYLPQQQQTLQSGTESAKSISEQLNYIIHLLEEQQNVKTSTTTEELILYSFLGIFTIYIVDSFTKVGKPYTR